MWVLIIPLVVLALAGLWYFGYFSPSARDLLGLSSPGASDGSTNRLNNVKIKIGSAVIDSELAVTPAQQALGLSYRDFMAEDKGLLFVFSSRSRKSFWMKGMRFPLDFVWIDGDKVADITENVPPPKSFSEALKTYAPSVPVNKVLEINAGVIAKNGIKIGDKVEWQ